MNNFIPHFSKDPITSPMAKDKAASTANNISSILRSLFIGFPLISDFFSIFFDKSKSIFWAV